VTRPLSTTLKLLFFGDIVGKAGRKAIKHYLSTLAPDPERVVIANAENATHGYGLSHGHYQDLRQAGVHILTGGNHIWDRKDIADWLPTAEWLVRPANMLSNLPGCGAKVFEVNGYRLGVLNIIGQTFMGSYNSPWEAVDTHLPQLKAACPVVFIDMHAEASAEKIAMGHYCASLGASAMVGTHTHVQTADDRLLSVPVEDPLATELMPAHAMGYLTDAGFNGAHYSVIGMKVAPSIRRMKTGLHEHLDVEEQPEVQINAVEFTLDADTGVCQGVRRINQVIMLPA
jgi:2',3'-cyclic-nucleotide 2'-phosphodiesterase